MTGYTVRVGSKQTGTVGGHNIAFQGVLICLGADGARLVVYGLHPSSPVPPQPVCNNDLLFGVIFVPFADLHDYVDLVRNEKPMFAFLNSDHPEQMHLATSQEPVGEEEGT